MFLLILVVYLLLAGVLTLVTLQNLNTLTHLNLYFWKTPEIPVGLLCVGAILLGAVLLYLVALLSALRERRELKRLRARVTELETQVQRQQSANLTPASVASPHTTSFIRMPGMSGPLTTPPQ